MAEWSRGQSRLADFVRSHLQPNEQIVEILEYLHERWKSWWWLSPVADSVAVVVTNQRLIVVELEE